MATFIGSVPWEWEGKTAYKIRNHLGRYVCIPQETLDKLGDMRYRELYEDHAGRIHVRTPVGSRFLLDRPYTVIWRTATGLDSKEVS